MVYFVLCQHPPCKVKNEIKGNFFICRYHFNVGLLMQDVRKDLKFVDGKMLKSEVDVQLLDILGPKTEEDKKPPSKAAKEKKKPENTEKKAEKSAGIRIFDGLFEGKRGFLGGGDGFPLLFKFRYLSGVYQNCNIGFKLLIIIFHVGIHLYTFEIYNFDFDFILF